MSKAYEKPIIGNKNNKFKKASIKSYFAIFYNNNK